MRTLTTSLLVLLATGCTSSGNPPVDTPDPPPIAQVLPVDPQPTTETHLDPVIRLERLDAVLETDEQGNVLSITASGPLIVDEILAEIASFKSLVTLNIEYSEITDEGLAHLEQLTTLTTLDVEFAPVSTEGVARLQKALPDCEINY